MIIIIAVYYDCYYYHADNYDSDGDDDEDEDEDDDDDDDDDFSEHKEDAEGGMWVL